MSELPILSGAGREALQQLPKLTAADRAVLERLIIMSPDAAIATASAILRTHQGDLHDRFFPQDQRRRGRTGARCSHRSGESLATRPRSSFG